MKFRRFSRLPCSVSAEQCQGLRAGLSFSDWANDEANPAPKNPLAEPILPSPAVQTANNVDGASSSRRTCVLCSSGWTRFDDYCYLVSGSIKTWSQAREYCQGLSGDLVKINSAEENEFVLNLVRKQAPNLKRVWIGLKWNSSANQFYWIDHSVGVYENWNRGEPTGKAREPCGTIHTGKSSDFPYMLPGHWNDIPCKVYSVNPNGIVCKKLPKLTT